jgi:hypothetical protein
MSVNSRCIWALLSRLIGGLDFFAMKSSLADLVVFQLKACAAGEITPADLHEFLAPVVWALDDLDDSRTEGLVYEAELILSEFDAGHRRGADLKESLSALCAYETAVTSYATAFSEVITVAPLLNSGFQEIAC